MTWCSLDARFLWAILQARGLKAGDARAFLTANPRQHDWPIPPGIAQIYDGAYAEFENSDEEEKLIRERAFLLISCASRPLATAELLLALRVDPDGPGSRQDLAEKLDESRLQYLWPTILVYGIQSETGECWGLSHSSAVKYFAEHPTISWSKAMANAYAAKLCLKLLISAAKPGSYETEPLTALKMQSHELQSYARHHWVLHIQQSGSGSGDIRLNELMKEFFGSPITSGMCYDLWMKDMTADAVNEADWPPTSYFTRDSVQSLAGKPPIILMCQLSKDPFLLDWLDNQLPMTSGHSHILLDVAMHLDFGPTALSICKKLIELGININEPLNTDGTSLLAHFAATGTIEWVKLLFEKGAHISTDLKGACRAMRAAVIAGDSEMVGQLLRAGVPPDGDDLDSIIPLADAAIHAELKSAQLLIAAGADVNRRIPNQSRFGNALAAAASNPSSASVLELLLQHGADVNMQGGNYGSALAEAAASGNAQGLRRLIRAGANVNQQLQEGNYGSALAAAAASRNIECLE